MNRPAYGKCDRSHHSSGATVVIITKTPMRMSFLGGGTDYPEHFRQHGGQTLGAAIDKYSYVAVSRLPQLFDYSIKVGYSRTELVSNLDEIEHPAVRECLRYLGMDSGLEIGYMGDLPARTGLGTSSSFTVGLLHALHLLKGVAVSPGQLAVEAVYVEQEMIKERVGVQDQYTCAYGGLLHLRCHRDGSIQPTNLALAPERLLELQEHLMLVYTGIRRYAHEVLDEQLQRTARGDISEELGMLDSLVDQGVDVLTGDVPIADFGELLHLGWTYKRRLSQKITTPFIDAKYEDALRAGALGGKLLGAGAGGFILLFVPPRDQPAVIEALSPLKPVTCAFDVLGSRVALSE